MGRKPSKPKTITIGSHVKARAIRGPREADGAWYWRAEAYDPETRKRATVSTGWADRTGAERTVTRLVADTPNVGKSIGPATNVRCVRDLMEAWFHVQDRRGDLKSKSVPRYHSTWTCATRPCAWTGRPGSGSFPSVPMRWRSCGRGAGTPS
jgi:hypothetical protein